MVLAEIQMVDEDLVSSHEVVAVSAGCPCLQSMEFEIFSLNSIQRSYGLPTSGRTKGVPASDDKEGEKTSRVSKWKSRNQMSALGCMETHRTQ